MGVFGLEFMRKALVAALIVGVTAPSIGIFLVQRRLALMGDGIGHVAFMGVAAGLLAGTSPVVTGIVAAALAGAGIEALRERGRTASDVALALLFYGGIAGGALLAFRSGRSNQVLGYLFGSVLTVTSGDLVILVAAAAFVLATVFFWRKELFAVCYDEEVAHVSGLAVRRLNFLIALAAAVTVGVTMRVVGILLVSAMLVIPVAIAQQVSQSFRTTMVSAMVLGGALAVGGVLLAYQADTSPGATIVLVGIALFLVAAALGARRRHAPAPS
ncbi:MAG TPA: metal ABC transporter permease [Actinomycetota bacterium]|nr:metal ABC transporter permease [Actinomycetota bacterium]